MITQVKFKEILILGFGDFGLGFEGLGIQVALKIDWVVIEFVTNEGLGMRVKGRGRVCWFRRR